MVILLKLLPKGEVGGIKLKTQELLQRRRKKLMPLDGTKRM